jgi:hypothetical protein
VASPRAPFARGTRLLVDRVGVSEPRPPWPRLPLPTHTSPPPTVPTIAEPRSRVARFQALFRCCGAHEEFWDAVAPAARPPCFLGVRSGADLEEGRKLTRGRRPKSKDRGKSGKARSADRPNGYRWRTGIAMDAADGRVPLGFPYTLPLPPAFPALGSVQDRSAGVTRVGVRLPPGRALDAI